MFLSKSGKHAFVAFVFLLSYMTLFYTVYPRAPAFLFFLKEVFVPEKRPGHLMFCSVSSRGRHVI